MRTSRRFVPSRSVNRRSVVVDPTDLDITLARASIARPRVNMRAALDACSTSYATGARAPRARSRRRQPSSRATARASRDDDDAPRRRHAPPLPPLDPRPPLITHYEARRLLDARANGETSCKVSWDFHFTTPNDARVDALGARATLDGDREVFMAWDAIETIAGDERGVYEQADEDDWLGGGARKVVTFSDDTERAVSLMPSGERTWPTALIAGFSMHRFGVGVDPKEDTEKKLGAVAPIRKNARLLDICTGLAYTSCMAHARGADVTTIELDRTMTKMCRMNPHSKALFEGEIEQLYGNGADVVKTFEDSCFDVIITDPPTFALAGELYSAEFYADLKRILRPKGKLYHYIGDPKSASGSGVAAGVVRRLKQVGFDAAIDYDAHGIVAAHDRVRLNRTSKDKSPRKSSSKSRGRRVDDASTRRPRRGRRPEDFEDDE